MDAFGPRDLLRLIAHQDGSSPPPDARQQAFMKDIEKYQQAQAAGAQMAPMAAGVASAGPAMAGPSPAVQAVANAMPSQQIGGTPMQPMPMMGGFSGVQLPRFR